MSWSDAQHRATKAQKQPKLNLATVSFYDCVNDNRELVLLPFLTLPSAVDTVVTVSGRWREAGFGSLVLKSAGRCLFIRRGGGGELGVAHGPYRWRGACLAGSPG